MVTHLLVDPHRQKSDEDSSDRNIEPTLVVFGVQPLEISTSLQGTICHLKPVFIFCQNVMG